MATTAVNALQAALLLFAVGTFAYRARSVLFTGRLDRPTFMNALRTALAADQLEQARALVDGCLPAWPARIALAGLHAIEARLDVRAAIEEQRLELLHTAPAGIAILRSLARIAPPLAFIGVISEFGRALGGGYGLAGLQRGLPVRLALERGLLTFALGVAGCLLAISAARVLARGVGELTRAGSEIAAVLEARTAADPDRVRM